MLEPSASLLPSAKTGEKLRVVSVGFERDSLDELDRLLTTLGVESVGRLEISHRKVNPATYISTGKVEELRGMIEGLDPAAFIFDADLSPRQLQNLEKELGRAAADRTGVIIEIFSQHARTKESKTQVELARLEYLLPRLTHFWSHFERQRGGIGLKGMGEKQLEVDRRLLKKRIEILKGRLDQIERQRAVRRTGRRDVHKAALVGYTNAGKSTLLNALTHSEVKVADELFATLDSSVRSLDPNSHPEVVAIDTVGFINRLPPTLVASFRSTLEELHDADLLVHVVDGSSPHARAQYLNTMDTLKALELDDKPTLTVINKMDLVGAAARNLVRLTVPGAIRVSAYSPEDVSRLRDAILEHFRGKLEVWEIVLPYAGGKIDAQLHAHGVVEAIRYLDKGVFYRVRIDPHWASKLGLERFKP